MVEAGKSSSCETSLSRLPLNEGSSSVGSTAGGLELEIGLKFDSRFEYTTPRKEYSKVSDEF